MSDSGGGQVEAGLGIGFARVLAGATSFKDSGIANISETYRGQIYTADHETRFAIIKDIPARELANEIMAAAAAVALGLPVPPAYLAFIPEGDLEVKYAPRIEGGYILFASGDVASPSVASLVSKTTFSPASIRKIVEILLGGDLAGVYEFDTWSANIDRHPGNILLSGSGSFWLIDQGYCFSGPNWAPADLVASAAFTNRLKNWVTPYLSKDEVDQLIAAIGAICAKAENVDLREVGKRGRIPDLIGNDDFEALLAFLTDRLPEVRRLTADALGRLM
ncbi:HipA family kinase [Neorhizobium alkalisoli]|uniref:HipA family kinase n=1 Tax=Neorhizobium alkalisoli TaxID=528178 RepID=UPI00131A46D0|nr:HipA family kinase [Neorhizobium alkalisoli]